MLSQTYASDIKRTLSVLFPSVDSFPSQEDTDPQAAEETNHKLSMFRNRQSRRNLSSNMSFSNHSVSSHSLGKT